MLPILRVLTVIVVLCPPILAQRMQTMMIPAGTTVRFSSATESGSVTSTGEVVRAFCIDRGRETPNTAAAFNGFAGRVRIDFTDGSSKIASLPDTRDYLEITGAGTYSGVRIKPKVPNVLGVDFLEHGIATDGDQVEATSSKALVDELFGPEIKPTQKQRQIWDAFWRKSVTGTGAEKTTTLEYLRRDPNNTLRQQVINVASKGDSIFLSLPNGTSVLIDTALSGEALDRIKAKLPSDNLYAIITHPDQDHAGNLERLVRTQTFSQIAMSAWDTRADFLGSLQTALRMNFHEMPEKNSPMALYETAPANGPPPPPVITSRALVAGLPDDKLPIAMYTMKLDQTVDIELFQLKSPRTSNDSSIATRVTHNGYTTLYAADITPRVMTGMLAAELAQEATMEIDFLVDLLHRDFQEQAAAMDKKYQTNANLDGLAMEARRLYLAETLKYVESKYADDDLKEAFHTFLQANEHKFITIHADNLKWPHHAWLPKDPETRDLVAAFVESVDPKRIIFSVGPNDIPGQSVAAVMTFLKQRFPKKKFEFLITRDDGNVQIISLNLSQEDLSPLARNEVVNSLFIGIWKNPPEDPRTAAP